MCHAQFILFTTKSTKDTKVSEKRARHSVLQLRAPFGFAQGMLRITIAENSRGLRKFVDAP
jgi:hypothetical protein